jgi:hypothetical protein
VYKEKLVLVQAMLSDVLERNIVLTTTTTAAIIIIIIIIIKPF